MRIQEGHFLKIALNLDLTLPDDGECPALLISCGIIDLGAFCVELWSFFVSKRISVPMSYIRFWEHCIDYILYSQIPYGVGEGFPYGCWWGNPLRLGIPYGVGGGIPYGRIQKT